MDVKDHIFYCPYTELLDAVCPRCGVVLRYRLLSAAERELAEHLSRCKAATPFEGEPVEPTDEDLQPEHQQYGGVV